MIKKIIKEIRINNRPIGGDHPVFIIAEAGVNHNGRLDLALKLVDAAKEAGADAIKFQTFRAEQVVIEVGEMAEYQKRNIGRGESQVEMLRKLELKEDYYEEIIDYCRKKEIIFLSTPHGGFKSVDFLQSLDIPAFKFGSGDLTNLPVLEYAAKFNKPMILGTGMADTDEVNEAVSVIREAGNNKIIILHCTTNYPCPVNEVNLRAMENMTNNPDILVGYSDHTPGKTVAIMAVALGVRLIEKHLTLDKNMKGPDHIASVDKREFREMVKAIRLAEEALGLRIKRPTKNEERLKKIARKSIVASNNIEKNSIFTVENIGIKRPGTGLSPKEFYRIIGKRAKRDIAADTLLTINDYE